MRREIYGIITEDLRGLKFPHPILGVKILEGDDVVSWIAADELQERLDHMKKKHPDIKTGLLAHAK